MEIRVSQMFNLIHDAILRFIDVQTQDNGGHYSQSHASRLYGGIKVEDNAGIYHIVQITGLIINWNDIGTSA